MIADAAHQEAVSASGGHTAVMLGLAALIVLAGILVYLAWPLLRDNGWKPIPPPVDLDGSARRDVDRAAARTVEGRGRWVG